MGDGINLGRSRQWLGQGARFLRGAAKGQHLGRTSMVFVVGCQRSGTSMVLDVLDRGASVWTFGENHPAVARNYRLRSAVRLRVVARGTPARCVVFKPLCDSQWTDRLLVEHPAARALWMYRRPFDVARSANVKWADHQRDVLRRMHVRDWDALGWRGERLSETVLAAVDAHYRAEMTLASASVLYWWVRNLLYFELGLAEDPRVLPVRYEPLVQEPEPSFRAVFGFLGLPFVPDSVAHVHARSVQTGSDPSVDPEIAEMAQELLERLDRSERPSP